MLSAALDGDGTLRNEQCHTERDSNVAHCECVVSTDSKKSKFAHLHLLFIHYLSLSSLPLI